MPRWRQVFDEETQTSMFVEIGGGRGRQDAPAVHGDIDSFVSPIDGSVITDRKQLREHNKRNNVVNAAEFTPEFYKQKADERAREFTNNHSREERLNRKREMYEIAQTLERKNG